MAVALFALLFNIIEKIKKSLPVFAQSSFDRKSHAPLSAAVHCTHCPTNEFPIKLRRMIYETSRCIACNAEVK